MNTICAEYSTHTTTHPPVGPCVLRPGHRGHIHQDVRGIQWATRPGTCPTSPTGWHHYSEGDGQPESRTCDHCGAGACRACGGGPVVYHNYLENPVCAHCADCACGERPCAAGEQNQPATGGVVRINSDKELQGRLDSALRVMHRSEQEIADLRAELRARDEAVDRQRSACQRALRDVCAVQRVRDLADRWYGQGAPATSYARELLTTLDNAA
ncbi:hypothetical protein ACF07T_32865 [Streptomyces sp. NPDC015184]|uniref:hypothetical protein n=1 Tax=Streptomyces sp. NPDC015184 TaxID=3364946 RepID=UPI0036F5915A